MDVKLNTAIQAYANTAKAGSGAGVAARDSDKEGDDFAGLVRSTAQNAIGTVKNAEKMSMQAVAGKADLQEVVTAVTAAELTLETVVAVRDKVITAYNEIMRMPI